MRRTCQTLALGTAALAAACSGGSGGGGGPVDTNSPTIAFASFRGVTTTPSPGDTLLLVMSESVRLNAGVILDDEDITLSGGGTLGSVSTPPTLVDPRVVSVPLGPGVAFTPGTTTVAFATANDAVTDLTGNSGQGGTPAGIADSDGDAPAVSGITINDIDSELNGTGDAAGTLQAFRDLFSISVAHTDTTSAVDPQKTIISTNGVVTVDGVARFPTENIADALIASGTGADSDYLVRSGVLFPPGLVTLTVRTVDATNEVSAPRTFAMQCVDRAPQVTPFENGQLWYLDLSRDIESFAAQTSGSNVTDILITSMANGTPDLQDILAIAGLQSATPIADVQPGKDSNEVVMDLFRADLLADLNALYAGSPVTFTFTAPGVFPAASLVPYASIGFSQMCIAGAPSATGSGILGAALFDTNNDTQENNCIVNQDGTRLGVFLHTTIRFGYLSGPSSTFRMTYDPLTPSIGGTPVGDDAPTDATRLNQIASSTPGDARQTLIESAIDMLARMSAVVTAHECGHSLGLVANGAMPIGLYGADAANFPLTPPQPPSNADGHIENLSLFPAGSQNVMSPAINFTAAQSPNTAFNSLNLAYLRQQVAPNPQ